MSRLRSRLLLFGAIALFAFVTANSFSAVRRRPQRPDSSTVTSAEDCIQNELFLRPPQWALDRVDTHVVRLEQQDPPPLTFVMFIGYERTGHSLIGAMLDAHPHMLIAHEADVVMHFSSGRLPNRTAILRDLVHNSVVCSLSGRAMSHYNYTIGGWAGTWVPPLRVIGDKKGGKLALSFVNNFDLAFHTLVNLQRVLGLPVRLVHVMRDPRDYIATRIAREWYYRYGDYKRVKYHDAVRKKGIIDSTLAAVIRIKNIFLESHRAIERLRQRLGDDDTLSLYDMYYEDLVRDPHDTLRRLVGALGESCSDEYLDICASKVARSPSRSRTLIAWPPGAFANVSRELRGYPALRRYSTVDADEAVMYGEAVR